MKFKLSRKALKDIEEIWFFTVEKWSIEQADRYFNLIFEGIEYIAENPLSGKDYSRLRKNYRCWKVQPHLIFYRINKNEIEVIRVLHQRMDIENLFGE